MQVRAKIQNLEKELGSNSNLPIIVKMAPPDGRWVEDIFKSKEAQDNYCEKIIELEAEKIEKGQKRFSLIFINLINERKIREKLNEYNLNPAVYLRQ